MVQHSTNRESGIGQNPQFVDRSSSGSSDRRVNRPDVLRDGEESSRRSEQTEEHVLMVGSWPCKVSSEVHINGRHVSEPVWGDKDKAMVLESEDENDLKRTRRVLSKGHEVVGPGYLRLSGNAARVTTRGGESGNPNRVDRVRQEYDTDRRTDRVTRDSRGNRDRYSGRRADRVYSVQPG
jgi:hypothetical protein